MGVNKIMYFVGLWQPHVKMTSLVPRVRHVSVVFPGLQLGLYITSRHKDGRGQYDIVMRLLRTNVSEEDIQLHFQATISHLAS